MKITLNQIKDKSPCEDGFKKLLKSLSKTKADDTQISISHILESNGVSYALRVIDDLCGDKRKVQLMCADFTESVLYIWEDWAKVHAKKHLNAPRKVIELIKLGAEEKEISVAAADAAYAAYAAVAAVAADAADAAVAAYAAYVAAVAADAAVAAVAADAVAAVAAYVAYAADAADAVAAADAAYAAYAAYAAVAAVAADAAVAAYAAVERQKQKEIILRYFN